MLSLAPPPTPELLSTLESEGRGDELHRVLASRAFEKTPTLRKLLTYLWHHQNESISEYAIATEALGRKADFEPRLDATVRVLVSRLRHRLKEFYQTDGAALPTRIVIPLGTHQLQIVDIAPDPLLPASTLAIAEPIFQPLVPASSSRMRRIVWIELAVILLLLLSNGWMLWLRNHPQPESSRVQAKSLPGFWQAFVGNGKSTHIIVPNPVFFSWENGLIVRQKTVNDFAKRADSDTIRDLERQLGPPSLSQQYVPSPDVFSSLRLDRYLDASGDQIRISTTAEVSASDLDRENLIILGTPNTLAPLDNLLGRLSFSVDFKARSVIDLHAPPGAPSTFQTVEQSGSRITTPGIIASLPGPGGNHILVLLTTYYTSALVSYLTSESGLRELQTAQRAAGNPPYFEAVIASEIDGSTTLRGKLVAFRPYHPPA